MNINKDNYEEYFLLLADNELSDQEVNMVETFVKSNPELEEELLNIKQSVFKPEEATRLEDKNALFRHTKEFVSYNNYEEIFILYNDDELSSHERNETDAFILENPSLKGELAIYKKTKLLADNTVVFPDKKWLFKSETKGKVVPFKWWRAVAAAVFLGVGLFTGIGLLKDNKNGLPAGSGNGIAEKPAKVSTAIGTTNIAQLAVTDKKPEGRSSKQKSTFQNSVKVPAKPLLVKSEPTPKAQRHLDNVPVVNSIAKKLEKVSSNSFVKEIPANDNFARLKDNSNDAGDRESKQDEMPAVKENALPGVLTASYTAEENEDNSDYAFYNISEEKFNKSKVGGFLRKVKRVIERKISPLSNSKSKREVAFY